jgi:hypothetical protein
LQDAAPAAAAPTPAPAPPPPPPIPADRARREVQEARALVGKDDLRARAIAERVLAQRSGGTDEVEALLIAGDLRRRSGEAEEAERFYGRAAEHPAGESFAEEALLRRAAMLAELGRADRALAVLAECQARVGRGALSSERAALAARVHLMRGAPAEAAAALEGLGSAPDRTLDRARIEVARRLAGADRDRARRLIAPLLSRSGSLGDEASALDREIEIGRSE